MPWMIHLLVGSTHKCFYLNILFPVSVSPVPACICLSSLVQAVFLWVIYSLAKYVSLFISLHGSKTQALLPPAVGIS